MIHVLILSLGLIHSGQTDINGEWTAVVKPDEVRFDLRQRNRESRSNWNWSSSCYLLKSELKGFKISDDVRFTYSADAGTITFTGSLLKYMGAGLFEFTPNSDFRDELKKQGITGIDDRDLFRMTLHRVDRKFINELKKLGYKPSGKQLIRMAIHGVSIDFINALHQKGYRSESDLDQIIKLRIHGVTTEYIDAMNKLGLGDLSLHDIRKCKIHGLRESDIAVFRKLGLRSSDISDYISLKIHGVTEEFIQDLIDLKYDVDLRTAQKMRIHGISASYVRDMNREFDRKIDLSDIIRMRIHGVTEQYIRRLKKAGFKNLSERDAIKYKIHNFSWED